jgi:hypothetical protein
MHSRDAWLPAYLDVACGDRSGGIVMPWTWVKLVSGLI